MVKNLPSNVGGSGSIPGQGTKIPYTAGQLSPQVTKSLHALEPVLYNQRKTVGLGNKDSA